MKDDLNENLFISELTVKQVAFKQEVNKVADYNMKRKKSRLWQECWNNISLHLLISINMQLNQMQIIS
jgi:hypothetical protein